MKRIILAALFLLAGFACSAFAQTTITFINLPLEARQAMDYYGIQTDVGYSVDLEFNPYNGIVTYSVGGVGCKGYLGTAEQPGTQTCSDGGTAQIFFSQVPVRVRCGSRGQWCNRYYLVAGDIIRRP